MNPAMPHFLLFAETGSNCGKGKPEECRAQNVHASSGSWRFVLRSVEGASVFRGGGHRARGFRRTARFADVGPRLGIARPTFPGHVGRLLELYPARHPVRNAGMADERLALGMVRADGAREERRSLATPGSADGVPSGRMPFAADRRRASGRTMPNYLAPREVSANRLHAAVKALSAKAWNRLPLAVRQANDCLRRKTSAFRVGLRESVANVAGHIPQRRDWGLRIAE